MKEESSQVNPMSGSHPAVKPGTVLANRFKILHCIGAGSIGDVFEAYDSNRSSNVALKVVFPSIVEDKSRKERLFHVIKTVCDLTHPNIATVYDIHQETDICFIVMELLKGESFRKRLRDRKERGEVFSIQETVEIAERVADALNYAHNSIFHQCLKPENIWLSPSGEIKVTDFGASQCLDGPQLTVTSLLTATVSYQAPEYLKGTGQASPLSDQFSLAAVIYELLTGVLPVGIPKPIHELRKEVPARFSRAVSRALDAHPDNRFASLQDFTIELREALRPPVWKKNLAMSFAACALVVLTLSFMALILPDSSVGRILRTTFGRALLGYDAVAVRGLYDRSVNQQQWLVFQQDQIAKELGELRKQSNSTASGTTNSVTNTVDTLDSNNWRASARIIVLESLTNTLQQQALSQDYRNSLERSLLQVFLDLSSEDVKKAKEGLDSVIPDLQNRVETTASVRELAEEMMTLVLTQSAFTNLISAIPANRGSESHVRSDELSPKFAELTSRAEKARAHFEAGEFLEIPISDVIGLTASIHNAAAEIQNALKSDALAAREAWTNLLAPHSARAVYHLGDPDSQLAEADRLSFTLDWKGAAALYTDATETWRRWTTESSRLPNPVGITLWTNSIGMRFAPIATNILCSIFETRLLDFESFVQATGYDADRHWRNLDDNWKQISPMEPVVFISHASAVQFCDWLTMVERSSGIIGFTEFYRLPTREEWSCAFGILQDSESALQGPKGPKRYLWGDYDMPKPKDGNFSASLRVGMETAETDQFEFTAPVGSFSANKYGLFDMAGNVWEWSKEYAPNRLHLVIRGGSWKETNLTNLELPSEYVAGPYRDDLGFRIVLSNDL